MGRKMMFANSARAANDLGFEVKSVEPALHAAMEWIVVNGYAQPYERRA